MLDLKEKIREIQDFPKKGVSFKDITPLLQDPGSFTEAVRRMADHYRMRKMNYIVSPESRGFILGAALAYELGVGFVPVRKPGKLPYKVERISYDLEYGKDRIEIHQDAIKPGDKVLVFDDVIATGGTARATCKLVEKLGGKIIGVCFLIELTYLRGRERLAEYDVFSIIEY